MTNADLIDDITGLIDDNDFDDALATITRNVADLNADAISAILDATRVANRPEFTAQVRAALNIAEPAKPTRKAPASRKTAPKKAPVKKEFAPKVTDTGRLDHTDCGHDRTPKGRTACRVEHAKTIAQG